MLNSFLTDVSTHRANLTRCSRFKTKDEGFIYPPTPPESRRPFAAFRLQIPPAFLLLKRRCPLWWQQHFHSSGARGYNTLHFATQSRVQKWLIDEEPAPIVKRIFDLRVAGKGPAPIARILTDEKVLTATAYYASKAGKLLPKKPYRWCNESVARVLKRQDYTGCTVNFKSYAKSHKLKKRIRNAPEKHLVFKGTQEPIIDEKVFERVQELRAGKRRPTKCAV